MPTIYQRFASLVADAAARLQGIVRSRRGPEESRVAEIRGALPPSSGPRPTAESEALLRSWGVYNSRVAPLAGPSRDRWALWNATDLTPETIAGAQKTAVASGIPLQWVELIDHIYARDIDYATVTYQRVADVMRGRWTFRRNGNDPAAEIALAFAREAQMGCSRWRDGLGWLLYSNLYSYNAVEVEWEIRRITIPGPGGRIIGPFDAVLPARLHNAHPKHFRFDLTTDDPQFHIGGDYHALPIGKFIFMEGDGLHPIKVRHGHAWQCVWHSMFSSIGIAGWAAFVDRFGMPIPTVEYSGDIHQFAEMQEAWQAILNSLGSGKGVVYPGNGDATLTIKDPPAGGRSSDPHSAFWDACKTAKVVRVLGAELGTVTGNVGTYEGPRTGATKYNLEEMDAARLAERIDEQLTAPMMLFNAENLAAASRAAGFNVTPDMIARRFPLGRQSVPRDMTPQVRATVLGDLVKVGMPISMESEFEEFPFTRAISDDDRIPGEATTVSKGGALVTPKDAADGMKVNADPGAEAKAKLAEHQIGSAAPEAAPAGAAPVESAKAPAAKLELTPSDLATVVTVNQALESVGLPRRNDADGDLTVAEFKAKHAGPIAQAAAADAGQQSPADSTPADGSGQE